jgi:hypothetical protein
MATTMHCVYNTYKTVKAVAENVTVVLEYGVSKSKWKQLTITIV